MSKKTKTKSQLQKEIHTLKKEISIYKELAENTADILMRMDLEGNINFISKSVKELTGYSDMEVLGINIKKILTPGSYEEAVSRIESWKEGAKSLPPYEVELIAKNGEILPFELKTSPIYEEGRLSAVEIVARDIRERKKADKELLENEKKLRSLMEGIPVGIFRTTPEGSSLDGNLSLMRLMKFPDRETMLSTNVEENYIDREDRKEWLEEMEKKGSVMGFETRYKRYDGKVIWVRESARAIRDEEGNTRFYEGVIEDITEQKKAEKDLEKQRAYFEHLFESAPEGISVTNSKGTILRINQEFTNLFGFTKQEAAGRNIDDLIAPGEYHEEAAGITRRVARGEKGSWETRRRHKNGNLIDISLMVSPIMVGGKQTAVFGIYRDITLRKEAEKTIASSLKEKEVMLREIHHRVKNNLQVIISLLRLQSRSLKNPKVLDMFKESQNRIMSMSMIHEKLYRSKQLAKIDFGRYIRDLSGRLFHTYRIDPLSIKLHIDVENLFLNINKAVPLGLIVNELLANSLKHAFPGGRQGEVWIKLHSSGDQTKLVIQDNGVGFPQDFNPRTADTLGMQLVTGLADQLKGSYEITNDKGAGFIIRFF